MTSGETENSLPLVEVLSKLSAAISRLDGNLSDVTTLMSVEDDIRLCYRQLRRRLHRKPLIQNCRSNHPVDLST